MEWERGATRTRGPAQRQVAAGETDGTARTFGGSTGGGAPPRKPIDGLSTGWMVMSSDTDLEP
jgi:hypothetical protein